MRPKFIKFIFFLNWWLTLYVYFFARLGLQCHWRVYIIFRYLRRCRLLWNIGKCQGCLWLKFIFIGIFFKRFLLLFLLFFEGSMHILRYTHLCIIKFIHIDLSESYCFLLLRIIRGSGYWISGGNCHWFNCMTQSWLVLLFW